MSSPPILQRLRQRARALGATVALPEALDPRVLAAAARAVRDGVARPLLVGDAPKIRARAAEVGVELPAEVSIADPNQDPGLAAAAATVRDELRARGVTRGVEPADVEALVRDPLGHACWLVRTGRADGAVMGAVATTAQTLRAALRVLGVDPRFGVVTSCFLMALPSDSDGDGGREQGEGRVLVYADCGVVPRPTAPQLADIAIQAAGARRRLVGDAPRVALLAFSTHGSAEHESLRVVREAVEELERRRVDFPFDGELQADAALVASVAERKAPGSPVAGQANVLVFPDLNSGNIAYKLTERLAAARAIGPLLQGLRRPVHDLSRGCSAEDIIDTMAITALDAAGADAGGRQ